MQVMRINRHIYSLALLGFQSKQKRTEKFSSFIGYLLHIPLVGLSVKIIQLLWQIFVFVQSILFRKVIKRQQKIDRTQMKALEQGTSSSATIGMQETQLKTHFLEMASHELKTPMTTILGQAQLMLRRLSRMPNLSSELLLMQAALESIDGQARRLNILIDDLLDLYTLRAGKIQLRLQPCNLVDMCREVVAEQSLLTERMIELEVPLAPVILQADSERLRQVVVNLVNNAARYSSADSSVKVLVDQRRDIAIIEVSDSGPGMSQEQQTHIFEPFYRGPDMQSSVKSGLGLGLAICKDIIEQHQGRIWCRSRLGKGSTFITEIPIR